MKFIYIIITMIFINQNILAINCWEKMKGFISIKSDHLIDYRSGITDAQLKGIHDLCQKMNPKSLKWIESQFQSVDKNFLKSEITNFTQENLMKCPLSTAAPLIGTGTYVLASWNREKEDQDSWWSYHNSNLTLGLGMLIFLHGCMGQIYHTESRNKLILGFASLFILGNIWHEIDLNIGDIQRDIMDFEQRISTDWNDFGSGMISILIYSAFAYTWEKNHMSRLSKICSEIIIP